MAENTFYVYFSSPIVLRSYYYHDDAISEKRKLFNYILRNHEIPASHHFKITSKLINIHRPIVTDHRVRQQATKDYCSVSTALPRIKDEF